MSTPSPTRGYQLLELHRFEIGGADDKQAALKSLLADLHAAASRCDPSMGLDFFAALPVDVLGALKRLHEHRNIILSKGGAAGHRYSEGEEAWVCDPWTQAFKDAGEVIAKAEGRIR